MQIAIGVYVGGVLLAFAKTTYEFFRNCHREDAWLIAFAAYVLSAVWPLTLLLMGLVWLIPDREDLA